MNASLRAAGDRPVVVHLVDVTRVFHRPRASPWRPAGVVRALDGVHLTIRRGARHGVVGESGSGKTTLMRLIAGLDRATAGTVEVLGRIREGTVAGGHRARPQDLQMIFQDPAASLDPRMRVGQIVAEPLRIPDRRRRDQVVVRSLTDAGLGPGDVQRFPHEFSGGERQRISIARAIAPRPAIIIADEAVSALDVTIRAQILDMLHRVVTERGSTLLFVSHDLSLVRRVCDEVTVLQAGRIVESGPIERVYTTPQHPYTRELLAAVPTLQRSLDRAASRAAMARSRERREADDG